jgi:hypothetical protein
MCPAVSCGPHASRGSKRSRSGRSPGTTTAFSRWSKHRSLRSPYLDNDFVRTIFGALESAFANNDINLRLIADGEALTLKLLDRLFLDSTLEKTRPHLPSKAFAGSR